ERRKLVGRRSEWQSGVRGNLCGHTIGKLWMSVEPGADRGAADREFVDVREHDFHPLDIGVELRDVAGKLLPESERYRVHQMRAANLHNFLELTSLGIERVPQFLD